MKHPNKNQSASYTRHLVRGGAVAAVYTAICLILQPISFGQMQVRVSEALTLLPVLTPDAVWGVTLGCFLSNTLSFSPIDMLFGSLATLIAAWMTRKLAAVRLKGLPLAAALPPILVNAIVVGLEITFLFAPAETEITLTLFLTNALFVGIGQTISCLLLGVPLVRIIEQNPKLKQFFTD